MAETAEIYYTHSPGDPLPDGQGVAVVFCLTGDVLVRLERRWIKLLKAPPINPSAKSTTVRTELTAGQLVHITYPTACAVKPVLSFSGWLKNNEEVFVGVTVTNKTATGFEVISDYDCIFEFTYVEPIIL